MRWLFVVLLSFRAAAQTPAWQVFEVAADSTKAGLRAEFRSPSHKTYSIRCFLKNGKSTFRIVPTEPGVWDYRIEGKEAAFTALPSDAPGYVEAANLHHLRYTGSRQPHLWFGSSMASGSAPAPFNHRLVPADLQHENEILMLHKAGVTSDLMVAADADVAETVARFGALNITWRVPPEARQLAQAIKQEDQYHHLIDYRAYRTVNTDVLGVEHQISPTPAIVDFGADLTGTADFRHALWRTTLEGAYPESEPPNSTAAAEMKNWFSFFSGTRHWELEPFFDAGGRPALALEGVEYVIYVEKPGPVEVTVEKHNYDVAWFNPLSGERIELKNLKTETFIGEPPDLLHDWVLHISREGQKASMLKSYKFESRELVLQEVEAVKVPFEVVAPVGDTLSLSKPETFAVKLTKETKASRAMRYLWTGEVTADGQPSRVLATGSQGQFAIPPDMASRLPALLHVRVLGLNGVGKLYSVDRNYQLTP